MNNVNPNKRSLFRWIIDLQILGVLCTFIVTFWQHKYESNKLNGEIKRYKEQIVPELQIEYTRNIENEIEYRLKITNISSVLADNIWIDQDVYMMNDSTVYLGFNFPRYKYFIYSGSRSKMIQLDPDSSFLILIDQICLDSYSFVEERLNLEVVIKWRIQFTKERNSKRYLTEEYFVYDKDDQLFKPLYNSIGGKSILNRINHSYDKGDMLTVGVSALSGLLEKNPPIAALHFPDGSKKPLWKPIEILLSDLIKGASLYHYTAFFGEVSDSLLDSSSFIKEYWFNSNNKINKDIVGNIKGQIIKDAGFSFKFRIDTVASQKSNYKIPFSYNKDCFKKPEHLLFGGSYGTLPLN